MRKKEIQYNEVFYRRNVDLGIDPECYECTSHAKSSDGYVYTDRDGFNKLHRWMHWKNTGEKPEVVMHLCDNPGCINPSHLISGTHLENKKDRKRKGRNSGEMNGNSKLTSEEVSEVRRLGNLGMSNQELGNKFRVSRSAIQHILSGTTWKERRDAH